MDIWTEQMENDLRDKIQNFATTYMNATQEEREQMQAFAFWNIRKWEKVKEFLNAIV